MVAMDAQEKRERRTAREQRKQTRALRTIAAATSPEAKLAAANARLTHEDDVQMLRTLHATMAAYEQVTGLTPEQAVHAAGCGDCLVQRQEHMLCAEAPIPAL